MSDCCIGYWCPCFHAYMASQAGGEEQVMSILQCFFYPLLLPFLRKKVREDKGIDVSIFKLKTNIKIINIIGMNI